MSIEGLTSDPKEVVLMASNLIGDIFINCSSNAITISNMTIKTSSDTYAVVTVHSGTTDMVNCIIEGFNDPSIPMSKYSIVSLSKADVVLDNCKIISDSPEKGILRKPGSNLSIDGKQVAVTSDEPETRTSTNGSTSKSSLKSVQFDEKILNTANC